ncbi:hypothetical protein GRAN_4971 [Granulicella sibirica]|uniref:Uncharacterized protein n=1 Tax=Granulicella sibirica TaxID=2479048 RepID=A0A4Q0SUJ6_9BACT|nr:hypothetical protein GRAN_4971 [Granulicella sibirica]
MKLASRNVQDLLLFSSILLQPLGPDHPLMAVSPGFSDGGG